MTTLAEITATIRTKLSGNNARIGRLEDATIYAWVAEAMREYNIHMPARRATTTQATTANIHAYALPTKFLAIESVEYPTGDSPPTYLKRMDYTHPDFWTSADHYDILKSNNNSTDTITISDTPDGTETITIAYYVTHTIPTSGATTLTIPTDHENFLIVFAIWQYWVAQKQLYGETTNGTGQKQEADRQRASTGEYNARQNYLTTLSSYKQALSGNSKATTWKMDKYDRTY